MSTPDPAAAVPAPRPEPAAQPAAAPTYDLSALTNPLTKAELAAYKRRRKAGEFGPTNGLGVWLIVGLVAILALFMLDIIISVTYRSPVPLVMGLAWLVIAVGLTGRSLGWFAPGARDNWARIARFADRHRLSFQLRSTNPAYPGLLFGIGRRREARHHVYAPTGPLADAGTYEYTTGSGKQQTTHRWRFAAFRLPRALPHLLLDAKANNMLGVSNLPVGFSASQRVRLGSPFDDHYVLYAPQGYAPDAFYLFPPHIMQALLDAPADYDIEIVDNWMFLYTKSRQDLVDPATWRMFDLISQNILARMDPVSRRWHDRRLDAGQPSWFPAVPQGGDPGTPAPASPFLRAQGVARAGQRLRPSFRWVGVAAMGALIALWLILTFIR